MPPVLLQLKSNAVGLPDNGLACYGMSVMVYDTGSIHHRADAIVSAFDIPAGPTATNNVSASVVLRSQAPVAAAGLTAYTLSWGYNADGSKFISCYRWAAGVPFQVGANVIAGIPTPTAGAVFSGAISGQTLTAFIGGQQFASFSDPNITVGDYAGVHFFRNVTTSNCYFTNFAAYSIPAPVTPPTGTRPAIHDPFASNSVWKTPRGDGALSAAATLGGGFVNASNGFGESVFNAPPDPDVNQDNSNAFAEGHVSVIGGGAKAYNTTSIYGATGAIEYYRYYNTGDVNFLWYDTDLTGQGLQTNQSPHRGGNGFGRTHVAGTSSMAGIIRAYDLRNAPSLGYFPHALECEMPGAKINYNGGQAVWPGNGQDGDAATSYTGGSGGISMGGTMFIPSSTPMPAGLSQIGQWAFKTMQLFVVILVDRSDAGFRLRAEANCASAVNALSNDLPKLTPLLVRMTNQATGLGQSNINGPGSRLAPLAPAPG